MRPAAIGILFSEDRSQVLLVKRRDIPVWVLPGGGIEKEEEPEATCVREFFEETGLSVKSKRLVGEYLPINRLSSPTFVYECILDQPLPSQLLPQAETEEVAFFDLKKLPRHFFFLHKEWIDDALKNNPTPLLRKMESISWLNLFLHILRHPFFLLRYLFIRFKLRFNSRCH